MMKKHIVLAVLICLLAVSSNLSNPSLAQIVEQWRYPLLDSPNRLQFGASPAIADLGPDVNNQGDDPDSDLEIVAGSDELCNFYPELGHDACGIWRACDSQGNVEWATDTGTDQSRSSPVITDINGDENLDIAGGTTSGWYLEVMDRFGDFIWTFPWPPSGGGPGAWHSSPAVADVDPLVPGPEVIIGCLQGGVWVFDGDNSDGVDDGVVGLDVRSILGFPPDWPIGTEGIDWDVLWYFEVAPVVSTPAIGDIDDDGQLEVVIGSSDGNLYVLDGATGAVEQSYATFNSIESSAGLADFDGDGDLEIVVGSNDSNVYFINGDEVVSYPTGAPVHSSPAIGDVDGDGDFEVIIGSDDGNIYCFDYNPADMTVALNWSQPTEGAVWSSPALVNRQDVSPYDKDWPMFRNNPHRTGFYDSISSSAESWLDIYVGSEDGYLYLLHGEDGMIIDRFRTGGPIHVSPSVADIDGDSHLEILFYDWGQDSGDSDTFWCLEDKGTPEVTVAIWPDVATVPRGGKLGFNYELANHTGSLITFDVWLDILRIDRTPSPRNPIAGPVSVTLAPYRRLAGHSSLYIPRRAQIGGPYTLIMRAGEHPDVWDEDYFEFNIGLSNPWASTDTRNQWGVEDGIFDTKETTLAGPVKGAFELLENYPNPFNPETWIPYKLPEDTEVTIRIYSAAGQLVRTLNMGRRSAGAYLDKNRAAYWDGRNDEGSKVASGVYFYTLQSDKFSATRKMTLLK
ncbi:MAG: FG-GAP-like repeat-containing protein [Candidatus Poribacteria bacterium]